MKKILSAVLVFVLLVSCVGCGKKESKKSVDAEVKEKTNVTITLLYSKTDGFNPFTAKTDENRQLCSLLFDSLFNFKADCTAEPCLASSAEISANACTVHLSEAYFSDGTPLTADDVVYSFNLAKGSNTSGYAVSLAEITGAAAVDPYTVSFSLSFVDPYVLNLLTFPIIKNGTAGLTDSDGVELSPVGSGKFTVDFANERLLRNEKYFGKQTPVSQIKLLVSPDAESISHHIEVGSADLYYTDASAGKIVRMSAKKSEVNINRLVYIGVNSTYGALGSREMRYAISSAVDRGEIVKSAYYGMGKAANGYFNPALTDAKATATLEEKQNSKITVENLKKMGYNLKDSEGYYVNSSGARASFKLLVNNDNVSRYSAARLIVSQCKAAGIEIIMDECSYGDYISRLASGSFQLYLGEIQVLPNMDMSALVVPGGSAAYGVTETPTGNNQMTVSQAVASYKAGALGIADLSGVLLTGMPQIPLVYRNGLLYYSNRIKSGVEGLYKNVYYSITDYKF